MAHSPLERAALASDSCPRTPRAQVSESSKQKLQSRLALVQTIGKLCLKIVSSGWQCVKHLLALTKSHRCSSKPRLLDYQRQLPQLRDVDALRCESIWRICMRRVWVNGNNNKIPAEWRGKVEGGVGRATIEWKSGETSPLAEVVNESKRVSGVGEETINKE